MSQYHKLTWRVVEFSSCKPSDHQEWVETTEWWLQPVTVIGEGTDSFDGEPSVDCYHFRSRCIPALLRTAPRSDFFPTREEAEADISRRRDRQMNALRETLALYEKDAAQPPLVMGEPAAEPT